MDIDQKTIAELQKLIVDSTEKLIEATNYDAAMQGGWSNDGYYIRRQLEYFLDGIRFATTGSTEKYRNIVDQYVRERDPEYQEFLRLQFKFGSK